MLRTCPVYKKLRLGTGLQTAISVQGNDKLKMHIKIEVNGGTWCVTEERCWPIVSSAVGGIEEKIQGRVKANETLHHIGVAYAKEFSPVLLRNYGNCNLSYDRAVTTDLKAVTGVLKSGANATAVNGLKNVIESDYNSREQQFGPPPIKWEFSNETSYILKLTLIAISIIQALGLITLCTTYYGLYSIPFYYYE
ncbi:hypothetical protein QQ045_001746 [Rhodiola kirilowii]